MISTSRPTSFAADAPSSASFTTAMYAETSPCVAEDSDALPLYEATVRLYAPAVRFAPRKIFASVLSTNRTPASFPISPAYRFSGEAYLCASIHSCERIRS